MRTATLALVLSVLAVACGHEAVSAKPPIAAVTPPTTPPVAITTETSSDASPPQAVSPNVSLDSEIVRLCKLQLNAPDPETETSRLRSDGKADEAPRFDFDNTNLTPQDTAILSQVARCLVSGPLAGRHVSLVGRADPRGPSEYNFVLGESRAHNVSHYLEEQGVESPRVKETSRGELDATGTDEAGWRNDRRVDIVLRPSS